MKIIIRVYDKADNLELDLTEDTTIQQIKVLAAEKLKLEKHSKDMVIIFNKKIINDNATTVSQLGYTTESEIILFIPRYIRLNQEKVNKPTISNPLQNPNPINIQESRYIPLSEDSPLRMLFQKLTVNFNKVVKRTVPFENPFKLFLQECNVPFPDPLVRKNFEDASKLTEEQTIFVCEAILYKNKALHQALIILANASYDPNIARRMI